MVTTTLTPKQEAQELLKQLPDNSILEDIQCHLYVLEKIKRGRADIEAGRVFTREEAKQRMHKWLQD